MDHTTGTRLFQATITYLRSQPMLTDKEIQDLHVLKEYVDRLHRFYRRRGSTASSKTSFLANTLRPVRRASSVSSTNGLMPTRAGDDSGLTTATIKGILAAVNPYIELTEYDINTSVFEKIFGQTVAFYWSLYKPGAGRIAVVAIIWLVFYSTPLEFMVFPMISQLIARLIATICIIWIVLYFWSQLNWRMTLEALSHFDSWFFITHALLYAVSLMALYDFDPVVIVYNMVGVLGFSAIIAYDAYPLYSRRTARYVLVIILLMLFAIMCQMSVRSTHLNRNLFIDVSYGLVHTNCTARNGTIPCEKYLTWGFNIYDFAFQRLQILAVYMVRNTYWAFRAPRYCVIIKSRVALEEVPVHGIAMSQSSQAPEVCRRNSLVRVSLIHQDSNANSIAAQIPPMPMEAFPLNTMLETSDASSPQRHLSVPKIAPISKTNSFRLQKAQRTNSNRLISSSTVVQPMIPEHDATNSDNERVDK
ncbi:hypothetical protein THRCLA_09534 [Thraustotheca clavata]|uniref:Transmembrane protein n=1 Tax=Thraustotheca clavata TaxID=74557 RepID=A0A1V9YVS9_9STRA|nr:hypothetical protein THRCLA_09534 [Thraustotheca clavata]